MDLASKKISRKRALLSTYQAMKNKVIEDKKAET
jgi:hypothetical protein